MYSKILAMNQKTGMSAENLQSVFQNIGLEKTLRFSSDF